jgi:hypothetical protein
MFGLVERFIGPKMLEVSREHWFGDQTAFEALVRFTDEELKHQELFRRMERLCAAGMPEGYKFLPDANAVASVVLGKSTWSVLALICHIEIFVLAHYARPSRPTTSCRGVEGCLHVPRQGRVAHAILDELEWKREDARISAEAREQAVGDLIELVAAVDGLLQMQAKSDLEYFCHVLRSDCLRTRRYRWATRFSRRTGGSTSSRACRNRASPPSCRSG